MEGEKSKNQEENCEESDEEIEIEDDDDNDEVEDVADDVKKVVISEDEEILKKSEKWERVDCEKKSIVVLHPDTIDAQIRLFQMELNSDCLDVKRDKLDQLSVDKRKSLTPAALKAFEKRLEQQAAVLFEKFASLKKAICDVNREKGKYLAYLEDYQQYKANVEVKSEAVKEYREVQRQTDELLRKAREKKLSVISRRSF